MSAVAKARIEQNEVIILDLIVIQSILIKMGREDIANNKIAFIDFINEMPNPPLTLTGKPFTYMGYRKMMERFDQDRLRVLVEKVASEPIAFMMETE